MTAIKRIRKAAAAVVCSALVAGAAFASSGVAEAAMIKAVAAPKLSDATPKVGQTITAKPDGSTSPKTKKYSYNFRINGKSVQSGVSKTFRPRAGDVGKKLSVTVCHYRPGYTKTCKTSKSSSKITKGSLAASAVKVSAAAGCGRHTDRGLPV